MSPTCRTCVHCIKGADGVPKCFHSGLTQTVTFETPACSHYILSEAMLFGAHTASLDRARKLHADFCDHVITGHGNPVIAKTLDISAAERRLKYARKALAEDPTSLEAVLDCEVAEFLLDFALGHHAHALSEAGDIIAVLYRALNLEIKNKKESDRDN